MMKKNVDISQYALSQLCDGLRCDDGRIQAANTIEALAKRNADLDWNVRDREKTIEEMKLQVEHWRKLASECDVWKELALDIRERAARICFDQAEYHEAMAKMDASHADRVGKGRHEYAAGVCRARGYEIQNMTIKDNQ